MSFNLKFNLNTLVGTLTPAGKLITILASFPDVGLLLKNNPVSGISVSNVAFVTSNTLTLIPASSKTTYPFSISKLSIEIGSNISLLYLKLHSNVSTPSQFSIDKSSNDKSTGIVSPG